MAVIPGPGAVSRGELPALLPRHCGPPSWRVYDVARVIDNLGDQSTGDRAVLRTEFAGSRLLLYGQLDGLAIRCSDG